jgi:hypothetical protein
MHSLAAAKAAQHGSQCGVANALATRADKDVRIVSLAIERAQLF